MCLVTFVGGSGSLIYFFFLFRYQHMHIKVSLTCLYTNNNSCWSILCKTGKNCSYFEWQWLCNKFHQKVDDLVSTKPQSWFRLELLLPPLSSLSSWSQFLRLWGPHVLPVLPVAWFHPQNWFHEQPLEERWDAEVTCWHWCFSIQKTAFSPAWSSLSHAPAYGGHIVEGSHEFLLRVF